MVIPPACLADPEAVREIEEPPMPPSIERPAGEPSSRTWDVWLTYEARRRERAELAGLYFQGVAQEALRVNEINTEQMRDCKDGLP